MDKNQQYIKLKYVFLSIFMPVIRLISIILNYFKLKRYSNMTSNKQYIDSLLTPFRGHKKIQILLTNKEFTPEDIYYLATHQNIIYIKKLEFQDCRFRSLSLLELRKGNWQNLECLIFDGGHTFIKWAQIAQMNTPTLTNIRVHWKIIGPEGVLALTEANWPKIYKVDFERNKIGDDGCHYLAKSNWELTCIRLVDNQIGAYGLKSLLKSQWHYLTALNLSKNNIGDPGCRYLSHAQWKNLKSLCIYSIGITKAGCRWLSKADWKSLNKIRFGEDFINWEGCEYLSSCGLPMLKDVIITGLLTLHHLNNEDERWFYLMKSNWKLGHCSMRGHHFENSTHIQQIYGKSFPKVKFYA